VMSTLLAAVHASPHLHAAAMLGIDIPNPAPADPTAGAKGISLLFSYVKYGVLIACGIAALSSGGLMAVGSLSNRPDHVDKGKRAFLWAVGGVIVAAVAVPVINTVFTAAS
jgi:hypothetical protein